MADVLELQKLNEHKDLFEMVLADVSCFAGSCNGGGTTQQ